jgi:hypothetical protein
LIVHIQNVQKSSVWTRCIILLIEVMFVVIIIRYYSISIRYNITKSSKKPFNSGKAAIHLNLVHVYNQMKWNIGQLSDRNKYIFALCMISKLLAKGRVDYYICNENNNRCNTPFINEH